MNRIHKDYLSERAARGLSWLSTGDDMESVIAICDQWVSDLLESGQSPSTENEFLKLPAKLSLSGRLEGADLNEYADALNWAIHCKVGTEPDKTPLIGVAIAHAIGSVYPKHDPDHYAWMSQLATMFDHQAWDTFADSAAKTLRQDALSRDRYMSFLSRIVRETNKEPENFFRVCQPYSMTSAIEEYNQKGNFQTVWDRFTLPGSFRLSSEFEILRRAYPQNFLEMIESFPYPQIASDCLCAVRLRDNLDEILSLLRLSSQSFNSEGEWQAKGAVTVFLLRMASDLLLFSPNKQVEKTNGIQPSEYSIDPDDRNELKRVNDDADKYKILVDHVLDIVLSRSDGSELGWRWLENLFKQRAQSRIRNDNEKSKYEVNYICILISHLSKKLSTEIDRPSWILGVDPQNRIYRAGALLSVVGFSEFPNSINAGNIALEALNRGDLKLLGTTEQIILPLSPMRTIPGYVLSQMPNIAYWFKHTWQTIRLQREQAWRSLQSGGSDANPAEIMALWGLGIIESIAKSDKDASELHAMWEALEVTFREARLVELRVERHFWREAVAYLFGFWAVIFKKSLVEEVDNADTPNALKTVLFPYVEISIDFLVILVRLYQNGLSSTIIDQAVSSNGYDLLNIIEVSRDLFINKMTGERINPLWSGSLWKLEREIKSGRHKNEIKIPQ